MAPLKLKRLPLEVCLFLYLFSNLIFQVLVFDCGEQNIIPATGDYMIKIKAARKLFTKEINILEPTYYINISKCYNAETNIYNQVIINEPLIKNYTSEELAAILGHEIGHIKVWRERIEVNDHSDIDAIGASLTSKDMLAKALKRTLKENDRNFKEYGLITYIFPLSIILNNDYRNDLMLRIHKIERLKN